MIRTWPSTTSGPFSRQRIVIGSDMLAFSSMRISKPGEPGALAPGGSRRLAQAAPPGANTPGSPAPPRSIPAVPLPRLMGREVLGQVPGNAVDELLPELLGAHLGAFHGVALRVLKLVGFVEDRALADRLVNVRNRYLDLSSAVVEEVPAARLVQADRTNLKVDNPVGVKVLADVLRRQLTPARLAVH